MRSIPTWCQTVGNMRDMGKPDSVKAYCSKCREYLTVDPAVTAAAKGDDYSLVGRRTPCRATPGCKGMMTFHVLIGVFRPLRETESPSKYRWRF